MGSGQRSLAALSARRASPKGSASSSTRVAASRNWSVARRAGTSWPSTPCMRASIVPYILGAPDFVNARVPRAVRLTGSRSWRRWSPGATGRPRRTRSGMTSKTVGSSRGLSACAEPSPRDSASSSTRVAVLRSWRPARRSRDVTALYTLSEGEFVSYILGAPELREPALPRPVRRRPATHDAPRRQERGAARRSLRPVACGAVGLLHLPGLFAEPGRDQERSPRLDSLDPVAYGGGVELLETRGRYPNLACSGTEPGG